MHQPVASLLFPDYRRRVLALLLLSPEEAVHGREVARRTGLPAGMITREPTKPAGAGLLRREKHGNQHVHSANTSGPMFAELASVLRKTSGLGDVLSALAPLAGRVKLTFVVGSVARGEEAQAATSTCPWSAMLASETWWRRCTRRRPRWAARPTRRSSRLTSLQRRLTRSRSCVMCPRAPRSS